MNAQPLTEIAVADHVLLAKRKLRLEWYKEEFAKRWRNFTNLFLELQRDPIRPYLATHDTLEEYCMDQFGLTARRLRQLTASASMKELICADAPDLAPAVELLKEGVTRELGAVPPERRIEVLRSAVSTPGRITARKIKQVRATIIDAGTGQPEKPAPCCPTCHRPL